MEGENDFVSQCGVLVSSQRVKPTFEALPARVVSLTADLAFCAHRLNIVGRILCVCSKEN